MEAISCDQTLTLKDITFYARVWGSRKVRRGFNQVTNKFYSSTNDDFLKFSNVKINFEANIFNSLNKRKRNAIKDRLKDAFSEWNYWTDDLCFVYDFDVNSSGGITLKLKICAG